MRPQYLIVAALLAAAPCEAQYLRAARGVTAADAPRLVMEDDNSRAQSYALKGALIGAVTGLIIDAARDYTAGQTSCSTTHCEPARLSPPFGSYMLIGAVGGLIVGGVAGKLLDHDDQRVSIIPDAQRGTLALSVNARW